MAGVLVMVAVGWWTKARCLRAGAWEAGRHFTDYCYSDLPPLWFGRGLADGTGPWGDPPLEYPVLLQLQAWASAAVARSLPGVVDLEAFVGVTAVVAAAQAVGVLLLLRRAGVPVPRLAWWAAAPSLAFYAVYNWDLLAVLLLVAAVVAHREGADQLSGALAGLGAAAKLFPAFLVPLVVLALLRSGQRAKAGWHVAAAAGAWAVVSVPALVLAPEASLRFLELNRERSAQVDSLWEVVARLTGWETGSAGLNVLGPLLLLGLGAVVVVVGVRSLPPERTWELVLPLLVAFLLTNKVFSPQYFLWLVPLMLLCRIRTAPLLAAVLADVAVFAVELPVLGGRAGVEPSLPYLALGLAVSARAAALTWVAVDVVRGRHDQDGSHSRARSSASSSGAPVSTG